MFVVQNTPQNGMMYRRPVKIFYMARSIVDRESLNDIHMGKKLDIDNRRSVRISVECHNCLIRRWQSERCGERATGLK